MSLVALALCIAAQNLVKGRTWAGDDVLLQPVYPIDEVMKDGRDPAPVIAVYAESSKFDVEGRASQGQRSRVDLKFFAYNAPGVNRVTVEGADVLEIALDTPNAGVTLNIVARQIDAAFHAEAGLWGECWRKLTTSIVNREIRYVLVELENGVKIPTAEIGYTIDAIPDPDFGAPKTVAWQKFDAALKQSAEGVVLAALFDALLSDPDGLPDWRQFRANFALTDAAMAATGLGPYDGVTAEDGTIPPFTEHSVTPGLLES